MDTPKDFAVRVAAFFVLANKEKSDVKIIDRDNGGVFWSFFQ